MLIVETVETAFFPLLHPLELRSMKSWHQLSRSFPAGVGESSSHPVPPLRLLQLLLGAELIGVAALLLAAVPKAFAVTSRDTAKIKGCQISMVFFIINNGI